MFDVVNWLNNNQGFAMILLTLVYVVATIVIVYYNHKSIQELQKTREEESRPYIFAYLHKDPRDICFYFRIKNYGKTGGKIIGIEVSPQLSVVGSKNVGDFLNDVVLAPKQMLQFILLEESKKTAEKAYNVTIKYSSTIDNKKLYQEKYSLMTQYSSQMGYTNNQTLNFSEEESALKNIANHLDSIRQKI